MYSDYFKNESGGHFKWDYLSIWYRKKLSIKKFFRDDFDGTLGTLTILLGTQALV